MMHIRTRLYCIFTSLIISLFILPSYATGPSQMQIKLSLVSVNDKHEMLMHYYYYFNSMGAYAPPLYHYGFGILKQNGIFDVLSSEDFDATLADTWPTTSPKARQYQQLLDVFQQPSITHVPTSLNTILIKKGFTQNNAHHYRTNTLVSIHDFTTHHGIYHELTQHSLLKASSIRWGTQLFVSHQVGNIAIIENSIQYAEEPTLSDHVIGARFNYYWDYNGSAQEYDEANITGWIKLPNDSN